MNRTNLSKRIVLYFTLISCLFSLLDLGLSNCASLTDSKPEHYVSNQISSAIDNVASIYVPEYDLTIVIIKGIKSATHNSSIYKAALCLILFILLNLTVFYVNLIFRLYSRQYIENIYYLITYIHSKDGRKRLMSC